VLRERCEGREVELAEVGGGWRFRTALDLAAELATVMQKPLRLPRAALEMLAIVAQYQPVTRAEIEDIRRAALSQATVDRLLELGLIEPKGTKNARGRLALWVTTAAFLAHFGLGSLRDVPGGGTLTLDPV
jgi:segregation and condensation protein B